MVEQSPQTPDDDVFIAFTPEENQRLGRVALDVPKPEQPKYKFVVDKNRGILIAADEQ